MFNVQFSIINSQFSAGQNIFIFKSKSQCARELGPACRSAVRAGNEPILSKTVNALRANLLSQAYFSNDMKALRAIFFSFSLDIFTNSNVQCSILNNQFSIPSGPKHFHFKSKSQYVRELGPACRSAVRAGRE